MTYTVVTDGSAYSFASKSAKSWVNGAVNFVNIDLAAATKIERQAPRFSSTHPQKSGEFDMTQTETGVYKIEHVWLSGQEKDITFPAGKSGFYYNAVNPLISSEDCEFDLVYSNNPVALKVQQSDGKNYGEKYYSIILDTNTMKLRVCQDRGERFWITGGNLSWELQKYEMDVDQAAGKATWTGYLKAGDFKLHGENMWLDGSGNYTWKGPDDRDGSGEWYFYDNSRENGICMNSDGDKKWNVQAGYYSLEFNYKASPMTFVVTPVQSLDLKVNGKPLTYDGNYEYSIQTEFTKGEDFFLSGCKNLEYVRMDPDFLKDGKFNAKTGTYRFILHLQSHDLTYGDANKQYPQNSWTLFKGIYADNWFSSKVLVGDGVADLTVMSCIGWHGEYPTQSNLPYMAQIEDGLYQFTGRYIKDWCDIEPYDRWAESLQFKFFANNNWNDFPYNYSMSSVTLDDKTGKIRQLGDDAGASKGNFTWKNSVDKWTDRKTYRMTVDQTTKDGEDNVITKVTFEQLD